MKPVVLAELLAAIKRVLAAGEDDLTGLHARLTDDGEIIQFKQGGRWVSLRRSNLDATIKAINAQVKATPARAKARKRTTR